MILRRGVTLFLSAFLTAAMSSAALAQFIPSTGSPRVLVILINFSDTTPTYSRHDLYQKIFGNNVPGVPSVADYYRDVSYGQLNLQGGETIDVVDWYQASHSHDYYSPGTNGRFVGYYPQNVYHLAEEAIDAAHTAGVDFSRYDNDGDGEAEAVIIIHQGQGAEITGNTYDIHTNMVMISSGGGQARTYNGVLVDLFTIEPERSLVNSIVSVGQIAHELGHQMGMPDTYDWDASSYGVGQYDLMCRGVWGANREVYDPDHPAHPSAYQKVLLGWITPTLITPANQGTQTLPAFETNPSVLKVPANPDEAREYFLLANLTRTGNHAGLPSEGLFIWHVDQRALFQNTYESTGCSYFFPLLALEQADGRFDLEKAVNWGDTTDAYPGGGAYRSFSGATTPNSRNHDCHLSGVAVRNISDPGNAMTAEVAVSSFAPGAAGPELKIKSYQVIPVSGDGDLHYEANERFSLILTLVNDGATATGVTASLVSSSFFTINQGSSSFPDLPPGASAPGSAAFDFTIKSNAVYAAQDYFSFTLRANSGTYSASPYIVFQIGDPPLLYVDDDGGQAVETYLKSSLGAYYYFYDSWDVARQGPPASADLAPYSQVLWVTGPQRPDPLSPAEQSAIAGYLSAGGRLILSSPYLLLNPSPATIAFARDSLHVAGFLDDRYAVERIRGLDNDPISNALTYCQLGFPYFPSFNRTVGLIPGAGAAGSVLNNYSSHYTGIRFPEPYTPGPRVIFLSFGIESHFSTGWLPFLLRRYLNALNYQTGEPFIFDISPTSGQLKQMDKVLTIAGMNFQPGTVFSFPMGGITVTNSQFVSSTQVKITIRIAYNAPTGYVPISAQNPSGPNIMEDKYFYVTGPPLPNQKPVADAGPDQSGYRSDVITLVGSGSDPDYDYPIRYQWTRRQGPAVTLLPSDTAAQPSFVSNPGYVGRYLFSLTVYDALNSPSDADTVAATIFNRPPQADAGPDQTGEVLQPIIFDASLSSDPEQDPLQYQWTQTQGFPVTLNVLDPVHPYFRPPRIGLYVFSLRVFDGYDWSTNPAEVQAVATAGANHAPVALAGPDQQGYRADTFLLDGSGSYDPNTDPITFQWTQRQGPAVNLLPGDTVPMPSFNPAAHYIGAYVFSLQVSDGSSLSTADTVQVNVLNHSPTAVAGPDQTGQTGKTITLDGSLSSDPDPDPLTYLWSQYAGPPASLDLSDPVRPKFTASTYGNYLFELKVSDGFEFSPNQADTEVIITSRFNQPPVAKAGPNQTVSFYNPAPVLLDGSSSYDPDGALAAYAWTFESRPAGSSASLINADTAQSFFYHDLPGEYQISLQVRDNEVWSFKSAITVNVAADLDSDGDGIPDSQDPDNDNDLMPDQWEVAHGFNPFDATDGVLTPNPITDPDGDGIVNVDEFYNESDPHSFNLGCDVAGCFFGDADGSENFSGGDLNAIKFMLSGSPPVCWQVYPPNCDTLDLDASGNSSGGDLNLYRFLLSGYHPWIEGLPGPMTLIEPADPNPTVQVGSTIKIVVESDSIVYATPRAGLAAVFDLISGSGRFYGGDGSTPPRRTANELSSLNSSAREGIFSISRDGLEIFFASDRISGRTDLDIYRATRNSVTEQFGTPVNVAEVNTAADETGPSISADRLTLYFVRNVGTPSIPNYDLFTATRSALDQPFAAAQPISELNSPSNQLHPMPSDDELHLYYVLYINWGSGYTWELSMAARSSRGALFGPPTYLSTLNTPNYHESFPWISSDELTIIFSSTRPASKAGWNLWMATRTSVSDSFGAPVELSYVNTSGDEYDADISADGLTLTLSSTGYGGPGQTDFWQVTRASTALPFYVTDNPGRYDITGPMDDSGGQNSYGRAVLRFQPTASGLVEIVVSSPADRFRYIPPSALEQVIRIQVQVP